MNVTGFETDVAIRYTHTHTQSIQWNEEAKQMKDYLVVLSHVWFPKTSKNLQDRLSLGYMSNQNIMCCLHIRHEKVNY